MKRTRMLLVLTRQSIVAGLIAIALVMSHETSARLKAQSPFPAASREFEVASIKPHKSGSTGGEGSGRISTESSPGGLTMRNVSLKSCMRWAYGVHDYQIAGPAWLDSERYDIAAKTASPARNDQLRLMLQALLADRFTLTIHRENKELSVYALMVGKNGPRLRRSEGESDSAVGVMGGGKLSMVAEKTSMWELAGLLSGSLQTPVVDMTGLNGRFDFTLDLTPFIANTDSKQTVDMPSLILTALQEQLGLVVRAQKGQVEILVVDHAERVPTED